MANELEKDLCDQIDAGRVAIIVGAGVSMHATNQASCASWHGLLSHGANWAASVSREFGVKRADIVHQEIATGDVENLLSAAEKIARALGAPSGGEYRRWLRESVGSLRPHVRDVLEAVRDLKAPIATTNYDGLLEEVTQRPSVTWQNGSEVERFLREDQPAIVHLHGHWAQPESVVLGVRSYDAVIGDVHNQSVLRSLRLHKCLLFVGCGAGLEDPNFEQFRDWLARGMRESEYRSYRLALDSEVDAVQRVHSEDERILVLGYGNKHADLAGYLRHLRGLASGRRGHRVHYPRPVEPASVELARPATSGLPAKNALWDVLQQKAPDQLARVQNIVASASRTLSEVPDTLPTYTRHDASHSETVLQLMADLLGERAADLTGLEAALLILSAYLHDVGLALAPGERDRLLRDPAFAEFLAANPDAYIQMKDRAAPDDATVEWYCRWRHAERVHVHLRLLDDDLCWGGSPFREELGALCESHERDVSHILINRYLPNNFLAECDLTFCSLLLRVADILDFDHSRSPEAVHRDLGLERRVTQRSTVNDVEWRAHLRSKGFKVPSGISRRSAVETPTQGYILDFVAGPDHPAVEYDVREFLKGVVAELEQCRSLLKACSERWRDFVLPGGIDLANIRSVGYRYNEYRFTLDQAQVLDLLMGENLYRDHFVFVRELIQNAIDASRHREALERFRGDTNFSAEPIRVSTWNDREGYHWIRVDDSGMGMDEPLMRSYLLKVGASYYQSSSFKAEMLRTTPPGQVPFRPISRFGIGLLSCFIVGDRVEISTRKWRRPGDPARAEPVRLSLHGLHGFYALQTPGVPMAPMPTASVDEDDYRSDPGTSIAVRLDPNKRDREAKLGDILDKYVFCSAVPIEFGGERVGGDPAAILDAAWCSANDVALMPEQLESLQKFLSYRFDVAPYLSLVPVDLTRHSPSPELKGQGLTVILQEPSELQVLRQELRRLEWGRLELGVGIRWKGGAFELEISVGRSSAPRFVGETDPPRKRGKRFTRARDAASALSARYRESASKSKMREGGLSITLVLDQVQRFAPALGLAKSLIQRAWSHERDALRMGHNGIHVFPAANGSGVTDLLRLPRITEAPNSSVLLLSLSDSLRPDVSVSRDEIKSLPVGAYHAGNLSMRRALAHVRRSPPRSPWPRPHAIGGEDWDIFRGMHEHQYTSLDDFTRALDAKAMQLWLDVPLLRKREEYISIRDARARAPISLDDVPSCTGYVPFVHRLAAVLVRLHLRATVEPIGKYNTRLHVSPGAPLPLMPGEGMFPPLLFCEMKEGARSAIPGFSLNDSIRLNRSHPFSHWLLQSSPLLQRRFPVVVEGIKSALAGERSVKSLIARIERARRRLAELDPGLSPPPGAHLAPDDFEKFEDARWQEDLEED